MYRGFVEKIWFRVCGGLGDHFDLRFQTWEAQKLIIIIMLHGELVTSTCKEVFIFMNFGTSGDVHDLHNKLLLIFDPPNYCTEYKKIPKAFFEKQIGEVS